MKDAKWRSWFNYGASEVEPAVQAEILFESARIEARVAILAVMLALVFGVFLGFTDPRFNAVALFAFLTVAFLLLDAQMRRSAAKRLNPTGPQQA